MKSAVTYGIYWRFTVYNIEDSVEMDLSSLEGPPISDTRFTPQARYRQPDTYYPYMHTNTNERRTNPRRSDVSNRDSDINPRRYCPLRSHNSDNSTAMLQPPLPRPRARSNPCFSPDNSRAYMQPQEQGKGPERGRERERRRGPPTRLIWLENERTWLMIDSRAVQSASQPHSQSQPQSQQRHRHRQSWDLPPSYGNHLGDIMIAAHPLRPSSGGHGYDDGGAGHGGYDYGDVQQSRDGLSRWGAVARRVNGR